MQTGANEHWQPPPPIVTSDKSDQLNVVDRPHAVNHELAVTANLSYKQALLNHRPKYVERHVKQPCVHYSVVRQKDYDKGDWRLNPEIFDMIKDRWARSGRLSFQVDAAADVNGFNAFCKVFCSRAKPFESFSGAEGKRIWCNPDWRLISRYVRRFGELQKRNTLTQMALLTPHRPCVAWYHLTSKYFEPVMHIHKEWVPKSSK